MLFLFPQVVLVRTCSTLLGWRGTVHGCQTRLLRHTRPWCVGLHRRESTSPVFRHLLRTLRLHPQAVSPLSRALCCFPCCCMPCCPTACFAHVLPQALTRGPVTVRLCITTAPGVCDTIGNTRVIITLPPGCYVRSSTPGRGPVRGQV